MPPREHPQNTSMIFNMSYNINLQHIIFRTKQSEPSLPEESKKRLLSYINSVSRGMNVPLVRINAWRNHAHILVDFPVTISLPEYVRKIKTTSSAKFAGDIEFPQFRGWGTGYGSFSVSHYEKERIINYIRGQEEHHKIHTFAQELEALFGKEFIASDKYWRANWVD